MLRDQFKFAPQQQENAEKALEALENEVIRTLDAHRIGIIIFNSSGDVVSCNQQWERLYQLDLRSITDYNILEDTNLQGKHIWEPIRDSFRGIPGRIEENFFSPEEWGKQGRARWTEGHSIPLFDGRRSDALLGTALFLNDITEVKATASEVEHLRQFLCEIKSKQEEICRAMSELLHPAGTDLRHKQPASHKKRMQYGKVPFIPRREHNVFEKLAAGYSVKETAHQLGLGIKSVYTYRARLLKRLNLTGDVELALAWRDIHREEMRRSEPETETNRDLPS